MFFNVRTSHGELKRGVNWFCYTGSIYFVASLWNTNCTLMMCHLCKNFKLLGRWGDVVVIPCCKHIDIALCSACCCWSLHFAENTIAMGMVFVCVVYHVGLCLFMWCTSLHPKERACDRNVWEFRYTTGRIYTWWCVWQALQYFHPYTGSTSARHRYLFHEAYQLMLLSCVSFACSLFFCGARRCTGPRGFLRSSLTANNRFRVLCAWQGFWNTRSASRLMFPSDLLFQHENLETSLWFHVFGLIRSLCCIRVLNVRVFHVSGLLHAEEWPHVSYPKVCARVAYILSIYVGNYGFGTFLG